jgi:hypothetical protein
MVAELLVMFVVVGMGVFATIAVAQKMPARAMNWLVR